MELTDSECFRNYLRSFATLGLVLVLFCVGGCGSISKKYNSTAIQTGTASWYGKAFHGKKTASGERYNMYKLTAAHASLPFGARVKVTHLENGKSVVVRINDRGPFLKGRIIDLSYQAAKKLDMIEQGIAEVRVEIYR